MGAHQAAFVFCRSAQLANRHVLCCDGPQARRCAPWLDPFILYYCLPQKDPTKPGSTITRYSNLIGLLEPVLGDTLRQSRPVVAGVCAVVLVNLVSVCCDPRCIAHKRRSSAGACAGVDGVCCFCLLRELATRGVEPEKGQLTQLPIVGLSGILVGHSYKLGQIQRCSNLRNN